MQYTTQQDRFTKTMHHVFAPELSDAIGTYEEKKNGEVTATSYMPSHSKQAHSFATPQAAIDYILLAYHRALRSKTSDNTQQLTLAICGE